MSLQRIRMMSVLGGAAAMLALAACEGSAASPDNYDDLYVNEGQPDAITSSMVLDGALTDADVAAGAAILGTKIHPAFGDGTVTTNDSIGVGTDEPEAAIHVSRSGPIFVQQLGTVSQPTVLVENPDASGMPDDGAYPGVVAANYGKGHPYMMLAAARGTKEEPAAFEAGYTFGAWIGRAYDGEDFVEAARISFVADATFAPGNNPTTVRFELGDGDPNTPTKLTRMVITSDGNVGVGTVQPQATLDVKGFARLEPMNAPPVTCDTAHAGSIALTSQYSICACNGTMWVFTHDGAACSW